MLCRCEKKASDDDNLTEQLKEKPDPEKTERPNEFEPSEEPIVSGQYFHLQSPKAIHLLLKTHAQIPQTTIYLMAFVFSSDSFNVSNA